MKKKTHDHGFSRRDFIKGVGAGVAGAGVLGAAGAAAAEDAEAKSAGSRDGEVPLALTVNGRKVKLHVEPRTTLVEVLRGHLGLTGAKTACNAGECGTCTVLLDGKAVYSCHTLALDAAGRDVLTIEGLLDGEKLHPIQQAFIEHDGFQCGFCTPGQIMAAQALLLENPKPSREEVLEAMSGNICRCAAYPNIIGSVLAAAEKTK